MVTLSFFVSDYQILFSYLDRVFSMYLKNPRVFYIYLLILAYSIYLIETNMLAQFSIYDRSYSVVSVCLSFLDHYGILVYVPMSVTTFILVLHCNDERFR